MIQKLDSIGKTEDEKIQILEKSLFNSWQDIYPLSDKSVDKPVDKLLTNGKKGKSNKFHNFIQNEDVTGEDLERIARERYEKRLAELRLKKGDCDEN